MHPLWSKHASSPSAVSAAGVTHASPALGSQWLALNAHVAVFVDET